MVNIPDSLTYHGIERPLLRSFIVALVIIALVSSASEWIMQLTLNTQSVNGNIINISGRQRMLSQNISKNLLILSNSSQYPKKITEHNFLQAYEEFKLSSQEFIANHHILLGNKTSDSHIINNSLKVNNLYQQLQPSFNAIEKSITSLLSNNILIEETIISDEQKKSVKEILIQTVLINEKYFLEIMDEIVNQYDKETKIEVSKMRIVNWILYVLWLGTLALIGMTVIRPTIKKVAVLFLKIKQDEQELTVKNNKLEETLTILNQTKHELLDAEKRSLLTSAIGGIVHDINTPLGICVTSVSFLQEISEDIKIAIKNKTLRSSQLNSFITQQQESISIVARNIDKVNELITSFKQIAVDQGSEQKRTINLKKYIEDTINALGPKLKKSRHKIIIMCAETIELDTYPSAFYQIFTNLIMNSIIHGFDEDQEGLINIDINIRIDNDEQEKIIIRYHDNGCGFNKEIQKRIFEPFFTTRKNQGGSGLGTEIIHKLVTTDLQGTINCQSVVGEGTTFTIEIPKFLKE